MKLRDKLGELAGLSDEATRSLPHATGVSFHSDRVKKGNIFFALAGETSHGLRFADSALAKGAAFIVSDKPHPKSVEVDDPKEILLELGRWARQEITSPVIGITGSAGKTSTKSFIAAVLDAPKSPGNFNTPLALATTLIEHAIGPKCQKPLVLELGIDHPGEMDVLADIVKPTHAVLTLIAESHLHELKTLETVASEKVKLLQAAPYRLASTQAAHYIGNHIDSVLTYGLRPQQADYVGDYDKGMLTYKSVELKLPAFGKGMAANATAALVVAEKLGIDLATAAQRLERSTLEPGRLEEKQVGSAILLDDSYNSNPASARQALEVLRTFPKPHTAILGDMLELGERSAAYHQTLGEQSCDIDKVLAIGPQSRHIASGNPKARYFASVQAAMPALRRIPLEGTILLKASRGMKFEDLIPILGADTEKTELVG